ncbi:uncharacterized protein LOC110655162 [Hevea brasiliensis]|uniref:uncharacterized protein LOC110655162 n=1 Tax=Hevea brasiliensis TaxID=3981 RepID=UPI0025F0CC15|nr:uncharacterized protein LOC110655162 [Hevea brasiliensis]
MATTNTSAIASIVNGKRTEANFENWKECMKDYLIGQGLWSVVIGEEAKPKENDPNFKDWIKKNAMALHANRTSCEEDTISNLMRMYPNQVDSAKFVWKRLAEKASTLKHYKEEDIALRLLKEKEYRRLGFMEDFNRKCPIKLLAKKSTVFLSGSNLRF